MKKFQTPRPWRYYTIMSWILGALTIGFIAAMIYKGEIALRGITGYICAICVIIPMRGVAYKYVAMDSEALYITDKEPNPLTADRILLSNIERVELCKKRWSELGRYSITIKQRESLLIESRDLGRFATAEATELASALSALGIEVIVS